MTITKDCANRYYASFVVKVDVKLNLSALPKGKIGIDLGTANFLTTSDGAVIFNPKFLKQLKVKFVRRQQELSRKQKECNNSYKARVRVARIHSKISDSRADFLYKFSSKLIDENQVIYMEDLGTKALLERKTKLFDLLPSPKEGDS